MKNCQFTFLFFFPFCRLLFIRNFLFASKSRKSPRPLKKKCKETKHKRISDKVRAFLCKTHPKKIISNHGMEEDVKKFDEGWLKEHTQTSLYIIFFEEVQSLFHPYIFFCSF